MLHCADGLTAHAILQKFHVEVVCTTDDPTDDLRHHREIAKSNLPTRVFPAFRPDKALAIGHAGILHLGGQAFAGCEHRDQELASFLEAIQSRHN